MITAPVISKTAFTIFWLDLLSSELLKGDSSTVDGSNLHRKCQEDYQSLKEEYERYKLRAQSVLKNKSSKVQ